MKDFDPRIVIETDRLVLRYMEETDTRDIFNNINSDKEVLRYFIDKYVEKVEDMTLGRVINYCLDNHRYLFAIERKDTHEVIGMILQCSTANDTFNSSEVGYAIGRKHWNQGYTTEAFKAMIDFLFNQGVHKVIAAHIVGHIASKRVMEKCGLIYEGRRIQELYYHEQYHDVDYYYLLNPNK